MKVMRQLTVLMFAMSASVPVKAVSLDGTMSPTTINYTYTLNNGEFAKGYVKFKNGINVPTNAWISLDITEPIDGTIILGNDSRLTLSQDLYLGFNPKITGDPSIFLNSCRIYGNEHKIFFMHDLVIGSTFTAFQPTFDEVVLSGFGNAVSRESFEGFGYVIFSSHNPSPKPYTRGFENVSLKDGKLASYASFCFFGDPTCNPNAPVLFRNVTVFLNPVATNYLFMNLFCQGENRFIGPVGSRLNAVGPSITIDKVSQVYFGPGTGYTNSPNFSGTESFIFTDDTSVLHLDNASISMLKNSGSPTQQFYFNALWTKGTVVINGVVNIETAATADTANSYHRLPPFFDSTYNFGDGTAANDLNVQFLAGSKLVLGDRVYLNMRNVN